MILIKTLPPVKGFTLGLMKRDPMTSLSSEELPGPSGCVANPGVKMEEGVSIHVVFSPGDGVQDRAWNLSLPEGVETRVSSNSWASQHIEVSSFFNLILKSFDMKRLSTMKRNASGIDTSLSILIRDSEKIRADPPTR